MTGGGHRQRMTTMTVNVPTPVLKEPCHVSASRFFSPSFLFLFLFYWILLYYEVITTAALPTTVSTRRRWWRRGMERTTMKGAQDTYAPIYILFYTFLTKDFAPTTISPYIRIYQRVKERAGEGGRVLRRRSITSAGYVFFFLFFLTSLMFIYKYIVRPRPPVPPPWEKGRVTGSYDDEHEKMVMRWRHILGLRWWFFFSSHISCSFCFIVATLVL